MEYICFSLSYITFKVIKWIENGFKIIKSAQRIVLSQGTEAVSVSPCDGIPSDSVSPGPKPSFAEVFRKQNKEISSFYLHFIILPQFPSFL